jgi:hypothetical protein
MVAKRKRKWNPLEGHHGSEQKETMKPAGGALYWRKERDCGTHWKGTMVVNRKRQWNPLEGHRGSEQKETLGPTGGASCW